MKFLRWFKKYKNFYIEPGIYIYPNDTICNYGITSTVRFLEKFTVMGRDEKEAHETAFNVLNEKYPNWNVWLF